MNKRELVKGIATRFPLLRDVVQSREGTGGTDTPRYCYSVWLRHLSLAHAYGCSPHPAVIAELGPGDSLGLGLAGLLSGSERYFALDVVRFANLSRNLRVFDELVELFRRREPVPDEDEFPAVRPTLDSYAFPAFLSGERLERALHPARVTAIRRELQDAESGEARRIDYFVPWDSPEVVRPGSVDMVFSQAVLEHVEDLDSTYRCLALWLKPNGFMSHTIDFRAHHTSGVWNGHWAFSSFTWRLIKGRRVFLLNRKPRSTHLRLMEREGLQVIHEDRVVRTDGLSRSELAHPFRDYPEEDATTASSFILAKRV